MGQGYHIQYQVSKTFQINPATPKEVKCWTKLEKNKKALKN